MKKIISSTLFFFAFLPVILAQSPDFSWAYNYGGIGGIGGAAGMAADKNGNIYMIGDFEVTSINFGGINLPDCPGVSGQNFCLVKFDSTGNTIWARNACGDFSYVLPVSVSADPSGNVFVTGYFHGDSVSFGNVTIRNSFSTGLYDNLFIVKYNSGGDVLWAKCATCTGLSGSCRGNSVANDSEGNIYATGNFSCPYLVFDSDTIFNADAGGFDTEDFFILKLNPSGNVTWVKSIGGTGSDEGNGISINGTNLCITGYFGSPTVSFQGIILTNASPANPYKNLFIARFDTAGNVIWAAGNQTQGNSYGVAIASNPDGHVYITGNFGSSTMIIGNDTLINPIGGTDFNIFTTVFDASGHPVWAKAPEEYYEAQVNSISVDSYGNFYIIGRYGSGDIRFDSVIMRNAYEGYDDIFIVKYSKEGNVIWAKSVGGVNNDFGEGITNFNGSVYIAGMFWSYNITFGGIPLTGHGTPDYNDDIYVAKLSGLCTAATILQQPQSQFQLVGKTATFTVVASGPPQISYQWYHNGYPISGATQPSFTTWELTPGNDGDTFYCSVSNCSYSNTVNTIIDTLEVCSGGHLFIYPDDPSFRPGDTIRFTGVTDGSSPYSFQWYKNGKEIHGATGKDYTTPILSMSDTGTIYYCRMINCKDFDTLRSNYVVLKLIPIGIDELQKGAGMSLEVFPNPTRDRIYVTCSQPMLEVKILDLIGQVVCQASDPEEKFSFAPEKPGIYFIVVKTKSGTVVRKFVKSSS